MKWVSDWAEEISPGLPQPFPVAGQGPGPEPRLCCSLKRRGSCWGVGVGTTAAGRAAPVGGWRPSVTPRLPGHDRHSMSSPEPLTDLGLNLALTNTHSGLPVNTQSCSEGHLRIILVASRGGAGWLWIKAEEADFSLSTLWALGLLNH